MPVPVPVYTKPPAHPVIKSNRAQAEDPNYVRHSVFQHLTNSLPQPPSGPPPAFGSREEWISSLPSWRRNKQRQISEEDIRSCDSGRQGFQEGLTAAGNAAAIKGAPAQAGIPPVSTLLACADRINMPRTMYQSVEGDADDEMSPVDSVVGWQGEDVAQFSDDDEDMGMEVVSDSGSVDGSASFRRVRTSTNVDAPATYDYRYERGAFSPVYEEASPDNGAASSPAGPNTPFGDYVDRAVASSQPAAEHVGVTAVPHAQYTYPEEYCNAPCYQCQPYAPVEQVAQQAPPAPEPVVTPTASSAYKKLAEPLADWVASFVWKVCTTGMSLPADYHQPQYARILLLNLSDANTFPCRAFSKNYSNQPPSHLAQATHSMLLSTLLQPSAVFLALWYIVRLPVFFGPVNLGHGHVREMRFRAELLGEPHMALDRDAIESFAPFRLVLLGCMLANKWLDDHTFSNKTWYVIQDSYARSGCFVTRKDRHTISNVPVHSLNKLEALALDLFAHDLSISPQEWSRWLGQLHSYHLSLSSPAFPQPISRPSTSPHNIIRKALEDLVEVSSVADKHFVDGTPEPVFYALEDQRKEAADSQASEQDLDVLEIDLDEDGPLREEYLPRRRISGAGNTRPARPQEKTSDADRNLPPPAKWSPAADEPIYRYNGRSQQYVAPQPISHGHVSAAPAPPPAPFHQALDMSRRLWPADEQLARQPYVAPAVPVYAAPPVYPAYEYSYPPPPPPPAHSRSQSLSFNPPAVGQPQGHYRSYSQSRYDGTHDMPFPSARHLHLPPPAPQWAAPFGRAVFAPLYDSYLYDFRSRPLVKV